MVVRIRLSMMRIITIRRFLGPSFGIISSVILTAMQYISPEIPLVQFNLNFYKYHDLDVDVVFRVDPRGSG